MNIISFVFLLYLTDFVENYVGMNLTVPSLGTFPVLSLNGWVIIQQRFDSSTDFNRGWTDYRNGFGIPNYNSWLGLEAVFQMTNSINLEYRLRIEFQLINGSWYSSEYDNFYIESESAQYVLHVSNYSWGDGLDFLNVVGDCRHNGVKFYTKDKDNSRGTAAYYYGGFWFYNSFQILLNGDYNSSPSTFAITYPFDDPSSYDVRNLKTSRMMMKSA